MDMLTLQSSRSNILITFILFLELLLQGVHQLVVLPILRLFAWGGTPLSVCSKDTFSSIHNS